MGKSYIWWENLLFPVDFPLNQSIEQWDATQAVFSKYDSNKDGLLEKKEAPSI